MEPWTFSSVRDLKTPIPPRFARLTANNTLVLRGMWFLREMWLGRQDSNLRMAVPNRYRWLRPIALRVDPSQVPPNRRISYIRQRNAPG